MSSDAAADVVAYVPDLMDRSRFSAVTGVRVRFVGSPAELAPASTESGASVVVVDVSRPGVLDALISGGIAGRVVGFGSHVDTELLDAARAAGCSEVVARSRFFGHLGEFLGG
jgi:hypothetical protein